MRPEHPIERHPPIDEPQPVKLLRATHWQIAPPFAPAGRSALDRAQWLARCIGAQAAAVLDGLDPAVVTPLMSSTHISSVLGGLKDETARFFDTFEARCGLRPQAIVNVYECTGWGFSLQFLSQFTTVRLVLLTIVDLELHGFRFWDFHHAIGRSGWGATTLLLELPPSPLALKTDGPYAASAFGEFVRDLRARAAATDAVKFFVPFFKPDLFRIAERSVGDTRLGTNHHQDFGHAFGSDPWIGIIKHVGERAVEQAERVIVGSVAYSGYYSVCEVNIPADIRTSILSSGGSESELEAVQSNYPRPCVRSIQR